MENINGPAKIEIELPDPASITKEMSIDALTGTVRALIHLATVQTRQIKSLQAAYEDAVNSLKELRAAVEALPNETVQFLITEMSRRSKAN